MNNKSLLFGYLNGLLVNLLVLLWNVYFVFLNKLLVYNDLLFDDDQMFLGFDDSLDNLLLVNWALDLLQFKSQSNDSSVNDVFCSDDKFLSNNKNLSSDDSLDDFDLSSNLFDDLMSLVDLLV